MKVLQLALDFVDLHRAIKVAQETEEDVDWVEVGTPLIKSEGLDAVRAVKKRFGKKRILADMKTVDTGRVEVEAAAKAGADIVIVLGVADDSTIEECVKAAKNYGCEIMVDLIGSKDIVKRALELEEMGVNYICVHVSIDQQMKGMRFVDELKKLRDQVRVPLAVAGGVNSESAADAVEAGADIIVVGGAIIKAKDAKKAARDIKGAMLTGKKVKTELFKRISTEEEIRKIFGVVSCANISDALHRQRALKDMKTVTPDVKMVGKAITVRTYPGDWAKPVEAIDLAKEGDVIVIDAGGMEPAVWGELASESCVKKGISGAVINGAVRDTEEIKKLKFPVFAKIITPNAGEPRGFGEIGTPIEIDGAMIRNGDWITGDNDGVVIIPREDVVEAANRAMDVLEKENRIRGEIREGSTLSEVCRLKKWEKV
ncbi:MAG: bifunctional hexulose-6-phosphate synthase/ribonuclease regulator [Candidatus Altiarchaeales archaeon WOR_SM1_86-2]|nr:MAG: bifunctional hexulose-6-phosphate synthase/ribonuclease regulator [Candidatus Altiarchaeales archaeon WOR_SM1_86-2]ODS41096.1 MAG: bifunctional hexulose-6-phosphate synthase/ribonuclease regulator [Candidatus Altiarchaeales archaeon WOR_SM1_79]